MIIADGPSRMVTAKCGARGFDHSVAERELGAKRAPLKPGWMTMQRLAVLTLVVFCLFSPAAARAQTSAPAPQTEVVFGMTSDQFAMVGAGVVVGALALHLLIPGDITYFAGGIAGGLLANWWYRNGGAERVRATLRPTAASATGDIRLGLQIAGR